MRLEWSRGSLRLTGYSARALDYLRTLDESGWERVLRVCPTHIADARLTLPTISGHWEVDGTDVRFVPRFPFVDGTSYTVLFDPMPEVAASGLETFEALTITRAVPERSRTTRVVEIYPTAAELPRNQLKLYIQFSSPMAEGSAATRVHVRDAVTGEPIEGAFLPMEPELWDPARRRLTILFDPARIKRGLAPHKEVGYPLRAGTTVEVVVDDEFRDAEGTPLIAGFTKRYEIGPDVRAPVDPYAWDLEPPARGTIDPLVVHFDRPLDAALLEHCLRVVDRDRRLVSGVVCLPPGERAWEYRPDSRWEDAAYSIVVDPILEDLAGNSVARVFDRDLTDPAHTPVAGGRVTLDFTPFTPPATPRRAQPRSR